MRKLFLIGLIFLSSCGLVQYRSTIQFDDKTQTATVISNIPVNCEISKDKAVINQTGKSWWEKLGNMTPKIIKVEQ